MPRRPADHSGKAGAIVHPIPELFDDLFHLIF
jgi:hypothetical protein